MIASVATTTVLLLYLCCGFAKEIWQQSIKDFLHSSVDFSDPMFYRNSNSCSIAGVEGALQVSDQSCTHIPSQDLRNTEVATLIIQDTSIISIASDTFENNTILTTLEIIQNRITDIHPFAFRGLNNLRFLNLAANAISRLNRDVFTGLQNLEEIILLRNEIKELSDVIPAMAPSILPSLLHIDLGANPLQTVKADDFDLLKEGKLEYLRLHHCSLISIDPQAFTPLKKLLGIQLADNKLTIKNLKEIFINLQTMNLIRIDLAQLGFRKFPTDLFSILAKTSIQEIFFGKFEINIIKKGSFPVMPNLITLHMPSSRLKGIENDAFAPLYSLKNLYLKGALITSIPKALLLPQLEVLDVTGFVNNPLRLHIPDWAFVNMGNLRELTLNYRSLVSLQNETFFGLSRLERLSLKKCRISYLNHPFSNLRSLTFLDLSENSLFQVETKAIGLFSGLTNLVHLDISRVYLTESENGELFHDLTKLEFIDLTGNSFKSLSASLFSNLRNLKVVKLSQNHIKSWESRIFLRNSNLSKIDLSQNAIQHISKAMLEDFKILKELSIQKNPFSCTCELMDFLFWLNHTNVSVAHMKTVKSRFFYVCSEPSRMQNFPLQNVSLELQHECLNYINTQKHNALLLITIAVILNVVFVIVIGAYLYHQRVLKRRAHELSDDDKQFQYDAFVSYSACDSDWVFNCLVPKLENETANLKLCVYDRDFLAGRNISDCILDSIKNSRKVILVLSPNFIQSRWCRFETELAQHMLVDESREGLVLIKLQDLNLNALTPQLNYLLKTRIYLVWTNDQQQQGIFWKKLHRAITEQRDKRKAITSKKKKMATII
ncbi:toll-like receptor 4 [Limulus polyphemus]|uniref:Toll-like receptor 4 n=1 Tax=Limulus polyphemus TaxID=6850 RepID=A0ABM1SJP7_LIMPO|nr:toll-like receptor 4 [Limulus polyphemus]